MLQAKVLEGINLMTYSLPQTSIIQLCLNASLHAAAPCSYLYSIRSTRCTNLRVLLPFHVQALNNIATVSELRMFSCELPFAGQTMKVFPLECFVVYGITNLSDSWRLHTCTVTSLMLHQGTWHCDAYHQ